MSNQDICDLFDAKPDMTLAQLSRMTGKSVATLKRILMNGS